MGSGPRSTTETIGQWPDFLKQPIQNYVDQLGNYAMPGGQVRQWDPSFNQNVAGFDPAQQQGQQGILDMAGRQGQDYQRLLGQVQDTAGGKYLDPSTNPYLRATYDQAAMGLTDQYKTATAPGITADALRAGAFGGSAATEYADQARYGMGQNLANLGTDIYGGNYQAERQNQLASQQAMPGLLQAQYDPYNQMANVGGQRQQQAQAGMDVDTANARAADQYTGNMLDMYGGGLSQNALGPAAKSSTYLRSHAGGFGGSLGK